MSASIKELNELHKLLAETFAVQIKTDPSPAMLSAARQFLRDNNIASSPEHDTRLNQLVASLPFTTTDETGLPN